MNILKQAFTLIALAVVLAGCVGIGQREVTVDANNGLTINEFSADFGLIYDNEPTAVYLEIENVGGTTATAVAAQIYGVSGWTIAPAANTQTIGSLEKPDIATNVPGEFTALQWTIDPPALPEGLQQVFKVSSRVRYDYYTNSVSNIDVISRAQYNLLRRTGEMEQVPIETSNTNGPVKISIDVLAPIKLDEVGSPTVGTTEKNLLIYVRNVGDGIPFGGGASPIPTWPAEGNIGDISLKISTTATGVDLIDCIGHVGTVTGTTGVTETILLRNGYESYKGVCTVSMPNDFAEGVPSETLTLKMEATYGYYIDTPIDVTVMSST